ncbi:MAG: GxxExxY protein [Sulfuricaulis sp.]|uniref:GxxExxY protein n=1 Tax=Sulfuricaulis sp. TaxID=2003553 RepID=UPI003C50BA54
MNRQDARKSMERDQNPRIEPGEGIDEWVRRILAAAVEVPKHLGRGYLESVYEEALAIELALQKIRFVRQIPVPVQYKDHLVGQGRLDFLVNDELVVELKAVEALLPIHKAQVLSYLKATRRRLGLLINFNMPVLMRGVQRVIFSNE